MPEFCWTVKDDTEQSKTVDTNMLKLKKNFAITPENHSPEIPPEITVTTPSCKQNYHSRGSNTETDHSRVSDPTSITKTISELPSLNGYKKAHLWHNKKCVPMIRCVYPF